MMFKKPGISVTLALAVAMSWLVGVEAFQKKGGGSGGGGGATSCKGDRGIDWPIQVAVDIQSAGRAHFSGFGGSDRSGVIYPTTWTLSDAAGRQLDYFPRALPVWTSSAMLKEANLEGLTAGASYTIALSSQDWCGNVGVTRKAFTMPAAASEANDPDLSTPSTVQSGLMGYLFTQIFFSVTDDSGLSSVTVSIDGNVVKSFTYGNGSSFRWWFDNYPFDNTQSALEGSNYYIDVPDAYKGALHDVQVVTVDIYGNQSVASAVLAL